MPNPTSKLNLVINGTTTQLDIHDSNAVDLTNNQTVGGNKEFTGTTTAHDVVPSATDTYNFGSPSYQWNNAYIKSLTINGVATGDILTHNASEFVNVTGAQTIGGEKTFSNLRTYFGRDISCYSTRKYGKNLNPTSNTYQYLNFSGNTVSDGTTNDWSSGYLEQVIDTNGGSRGRWFVQDTSENPVGLELWASGNDKQVRPFQSNSTDLGTSTKKWKSFNGINPGALSLPKTESDRYSFTDLSSIPGIDVDNWVLDGGKIVIAAEYVITGWLYVCIACGTDGYVILQTGGYSYPNCFYKITGTPIARYASAMIPIVKGIAVTLYLKGTSLLHARYYPAAGNV